MADTTKKASVQIVNEEQENMAVGRGGNNRRGEQNPHQNE